MSGPTNVLTSEKQVYLEFFGDFLKGLSRKMNFIFSLSKPTDGNWGGRAAGRKLGWN